MTSSPEALIVAALQRRSGAHQNNHTLSILYGFINNRMS
jgi:hypothetical protein